MVVSEMAISKNWIAAMRFCASCRKDLRDDRSMFESQLLFSIRMIVAPKSWFQTSISIAHALAMNVA
jgi:hypothetical protein